MILRKTDSAYRPIAGAKFELLRVDMTPVDGENVSASSGEKVAAIAKELGEDEKKVTSALEAISEPLSIFDPVFSDGDDSVFVMDQLSDKDNTDETWLEDIALREAMKKLNERERSIISMRYYGGKTQVQIAEEIGISQAQVSRLEKSAFERMKKNM